jgi:MYXO-CTERM domain-containing protein
MMRLREDAPAEIPVMPFNLEPLPESTMGATVRTVGFGVTNGETQTGAGTKRSAFFTVNSLTSVHIGLGDETKNICQGDSGGPTLMDIGGTETVVAVSSFGSNFCMNESKVVRTDAYRDWMIEVYDAWDGPCQFDGECVTEGCRTPDPDCDSCGFDGFCATGCDKLDLDCPIVGFATDLCSNNDGCESRVCVEGLDDPRVKYCSESCETAGDCPAPLSICEDGACYVSGPSPGAQGDDCTAGSDCRSGACDPDHSICIEQCGDGLPECPDPYSCVKVGGVKACSIGSEGGCAVAAAGRTGAAGFAWLLAAFAALVAVRRRRR